MKLKEYIESLNDKLPKNLSNYKITIEYSFNIFKLNSTKNVVLYSCVLESELDNFNPNFIYYVQRSNPNPDLYAYHTNKNGEVRKIRIGRFEYYKDLNALYFYFNKSEFKTLIKAVRKAFGIKSKKGKTTNKITFLNKFEFTKEKYLFIPKKVDYYDYEFTDNSKKRLSKEESFIASEYAIKNNLGIKSICPSIEYNFEKQIEETIF